MFDRERAVFDFNLTILERMCQDVTDANYRDPVTPGGNAPAWILGHLSLACDNVLQVLGKEALLPKSWGTWFRSGSKPDALPLELPSKDQLMTALRAGHTAVSHAAVAPDSGRLGHPHTLPWFEHSPLRTWADVVAYYITHHESFHMGQLSVWRRAHGHPPLF